MPESKMETYVEKVRRTHVPDEEMCCRGCTTPWPCDAANMLLAYDHVEKAAAATFANSKEMVKQLLDIEEVLNPLLGGDVSIEYQPAVYLQEAEEVGGRSKWAMRYTDEAEQFRHYKTRMDRKLGRIRDILGRLTIR